ncbi:MAG: hypothetical protein GX149_00595 [Acholeplasmataceae bacterium]|nr:hypothetical protein [Acholeplasmataceae bacterium]
MRRLKIFTVVAMLLLVLVGCNNNGENGLEEEIDLSKIAINISFESGEGLEHVTKNFILPIEFEDNVTAIWQSDDETVIVVAGDQAIVTRFSENKKVKLIPTLKYQPEGEAEISLIREAIEVTVIKLETSTELPPEITGVVYHWLPNSRGADITAKINLQGVDVNDVVVSCESVELIEGLDFEIIGDEDFILFGDFLVEYTNEVGTYQLAIETPTGTTAFEYFVVDNLEGTTIPTTETTVSDLGFLTQAEITEPIADAPELLITEVSADSGAYSYIEVFNNSNQQRNLKGHMLIFGDLGRQTNINSLVEEYNWLIAEPMNAVPFYIYKDFVMEPFETAIIWYIGGNRTPWNLEGDTNYNIIYENEGKNSKAFLFDWQGGNLKERTLKNIHGIPESTRVVSVRNNSFVINNTTTRNENGFGTPVIRAAAFESQNSSISHRAVQILYFNPEKKYTPDEFAPENASYYTIDSGVLNQEEDIYEEGYLDSSKITRLPGNRLSINTFYFRKLYYNSDDEFIEYDKTWNPATDQKNGMWESEEYFKVAKDAILATAVFFPKLEGSTVSSRWERGHGMEYTIPENGSHLMRFVPRSEDADYLTYIYYTYFQSNVLEFVKGGVSEIIPEMLATRTVVVPVDPAYNYSVPVKENTAGITSKYNLGIKNED